MGAEKLTQILLGDERVSIKFVADAIVDKGSWDTQRHSNAEYELHVILKGRCSVSIDETNCVLEAGNAIIIAPGQYHLPVVEPGEFERLSLPFDIREGYLGQLLRGRVQDYLSFAISTETEQVCRWIHNECAQHHAFKDDVLFALLTLLLAGIFRTIGLLPKEKPNRAFPSIGQRTSTIDDFFEKNFAEYGTEEALAESLHLSKRQLARVLNEQYGMSFREKLLSTRMDHAGWLLRSTDMKVSEISAAVGYSSEGSFFKTFKEYYKTTPQKYRGTFHTGRPSRFGRFPMYPLFHAPMVGYCNEFTLNHP